jgi:Zn finger protein HypA/HybF involved in hydrogenase expression
MASKRKTKEKTTRETRKKKIVKTVEKGKKLPPKREEITLKDLGRSKLVDEDLKCIEHKIMFREPEHQEGGKKPGLFYRKFVFRCEKCIHEFEHEVVIPGIKLKVTCPKCSEEHTVGVVPAAGHYEIRLPKELTSRGVRGKRG